MLTARQGSAFYGAGTAAGDFWSEANPPDENYALTPREREVLSLIGSGLYNFEICDRLGISYHTLHRHVNAVLTKLDARKRMEVFTIGLRDGLLECPRLCQYRYAGTA